MKKKNATTYVMVGTLILVLMVLIGVAYLKGRFIKDISMAGIMAAMSVLGFLGGSFITKSLDIRKALLLAKVAGILDLVETENGYAMKLDLHMPLYDVAQEDHIILAVGFDKDIFDQEEKDGDSREGSKV